MHAARLGRDIAARAVLSVGAIVAVARREAFDTASPLAPFTAQASGGQPLLALRIALLGVALWSLDRPGGRAAAARVGLSVLLLGSLAVKLLVVPFAIAALALTLSRPLPELPWPAGARKAALVGSLAAVLVFAVHAGLEGPPAAAPSAVDPAAQAARWAARDNPFRARYWASRVAAPRGHGDAP